VDLPIEAVLPSVPCIMCWQPSYPEPGADPVCSPQCETTLAGTVAELAEILIAAGRER